jgi:hypothetical protein
MFESLTAIGIFIAFLVPGYLWWSIEVQLAYLNRRLEWEKFAVGLVTRSALVYLPWAPLLLRAYKEQYYAASPWASVAFCSLIMVLQPIVIGALWGRIRLKGNDRAVLRKFGFIPLEQNHAPTAWLAMFAGRAPSWIIVTLKDGSMVKGWFGVESHASSDDMHRDLFVSHVVRVLANGDEELVENTAGVYIAPDEIKTVEFIKNSSET